MDEIYDNSEETARIYLENGFFVDFTKHFKYLGSYISYHLRDNYDIEMRLSQAYSTMGALKHFWNNQYVDLFCQIPSVHGVLREHPSLGVQILGSQRIQP